MEDKLGQTRLLFSFQDGRLGPFTCLSKVFLPPASGRKFHLLLRWKGSEAWRAIKLYRHTMTGASYRAVVVQGISTTAVSVARE